MQILQGFRAEHCDIAELALAASLAKLKPCDMSEVVSNFVGLYKVCRVRV